MDDLRSYDIEAGYTFTTLVHNWREKIKELEFEKREAEGRALSSQQINNSPVQTSKGFSRSPAGALKALEIQDQIDDIEASLKQFESAVKTLEDGEQEIINAYCEGLTLHEYALKNHLSKSRALKYRSDQALSNLYSAISDALKER